MYESLLKELEGEGIEVIQVNFKGNIKGLYGENTIALSSKLETDQEKNCVLAEEMGHYNKTAGNIINTKDINNMKQEKIARNWAYEKLVSITDLLNAFNAGTKNRYEIAEYLGVTEKFLNAAIDHYKEKYGLSYEIDSYIIYFEPLGILKMF